MNLEELIKKNANLETPTLIDLLKSKDSSKRSFAAEYLRHPKHRKKETFDALTQQIQKESEESMVFTDLIETISYFSEEKYAKSIACKLLEPLLKSEDELIKVFTIEALWNYGNKNVIPQLKEFSQDFKEDQLVRAYAISGIGFLNAKEEVPFLKELLKEESDEEVLLRIYDSLYMLTSKVEYFDSIISLFSTKNIRLRNAIANTLEEIALREPEKTSFIFKTLKKILTKEKSRSVISTIKRILNDNEALKI